MWNGTSTENWEADEDGVYHITCAADLKAFADAVNRPSEGSLYNLGGKTFLNETVVLDTGIDLNNKEWTPIGQTGFGQFQGTFEGQGHTIKNFNVTSENIGDYVAGFFGWTNSNAHIKNVIFENANIQSNKFAGVVVAYSECHSNTTTIENCVVRKCTVVANSEHAGGLAGVINTSAEVINNKVENCSVTTNNGYTAGGLVGWIPGTVSITGNHVSSTTIVLNNHNNVGLSGPLAGIFVGSTSNDISNNSGYENSAIVNS